MEHKSQIDRIDFGPLADWLLGPVRQALFDAALELGIADHLARTDDPEVLAERLGGAHRGNLELLLDALAALGLVEKREGRYTNTPLADLYMRRDRETFLGGMLQSLEPMWHRNLSRLLELVRTGPPPEVDKDVRLASPEHWKRAAHHLANYQRAYLARVAADIAEALPEFPDMRRMLDLGGGPGLVGMAILERHPRLQGVLLDLPPVLETAQEEAAARKLGDRLSLLVGDYNQVGLGEGYDLIWASHTLYYVKDLVAFFRRIRDALNPQGVFLCLHEGLVGERTGPSHHILARLSLALEGQDVSFNQGELAGKMREAGFARVESRCLEMPMGTNWLDTARKAVGASGGGG
jgi:SAM-dependent methyltransferase